MQNFPTTGSKLSETPSEVRKTMSPGWTKVRLHVRLLSSGLIPSTGPRAPEGKGVMKMMLSMQTFFGFLLKNLTLAYPMHLSCLCWTGCRASPA